MSIDTFTSCWINTLLFLQGTMFFEKEFISVWRGAPLTEIPQLEVFQGTLSQAKHGAEH